MRVMRSMPMRFLPFRLQFATCLGGGFPIVAKFEEGRDRQSPLQLPRQVQQLTPKLAAITGCRLVSNIYRHVVLL